MPTLKKVRAFKEALDEYFKAKTNLLNTPEGDELIYYDELIFENIKNLIIVLKNLIIIEEAFSKKINMHKLDHLINVHINMMKKIYSKIGMEKKIENIFKNLINTYLEYLILNDYLNIEETNNYEQEFEPNKIETKDLTYT